MIHRFVTCLAAASIVSIAAAADNPIPLWPGDAPGEKGDIGVEQDMTRPADGMVAGKRVIRIGNVSKPTLTVYRASKENNSRAAVVVFPGGGYHILAMDLEGTEVCQWLNSVGVNAVLVKYRVPKRSWEEKHTAPLQDAQRAMSLVRQRADELGVDPRKIGVMGFSAGGHLCASLSATAADRAYPAVDAADKVSCRPDFTMLIYPAYLMLKEKPDTIAPEVAVTANTPSMFIVMAEDDPIGVENALRYSIGLKQAKVPVELHIYPKGGHGYGLRRTANPLTAWPDRAAEWMKSQGWLRSAKSE
jgi:acetyl esterase/lipase